MDGDCALAGTDWVDRGGEHICVSTALRGGELLVACDLIAATFDITDSILDELRSALRTVNLMTIVRRPVRRRRLRRDRSRTLR